MNRTVFLGFAVLLSAVSSRAQYVRPTFTNSEIVVVARTTRTHPSAQGFSWRNDRPTEREPIEVLAIDLHVYSYIKGSGPTDITIALPKSLVRTAADDSGNRRFDGRTGKTNLWFI